MSVMGFQKKSFDGGWVCGVSSIQFHFGVLDFIKLCKAPYCIFINQVADFNPLRLQYVILRTQFQSRCDYDT